MNQSAARCGFRVDRRQFAEVHLSEADARLIAALVEDDWIADFWKEALGVVVLARRVFFVRVAIMCLSSTPNFLSNLLRQSEM